MNTSTEMPKLSLNHVGKTYQLNKTESVKAIESITFDVHNNEMCVLLGPSGCGKSTALRLVAGLESPDEGSLVLDGHPISGPGRERGMVFQAYTSFDWLTVQQNVEYGMRLNGVRRPERRERANHFLNLVGLSRFRNAHPNQLSGGMKQRVAIARTLANDPSLLLLDEPFGALDAETRWHMQEFMVKVLEESHTTALLVTHDIEEGLFLADRIIFLSRGPGHVVEDLDMSFKQGCRIGSKEELYALEGYADIERHIMHLMRQEGAVAN